MKGPLGLKFYNIASLRYSINDYYLIPIFVMASNKRKKFRVFFLLRFFPDSDFLNFKFRQIAVGVFLSFVRWGLPQSKLLFSSALFFSLTSFLGLKWPTNHRYLKTLEWLKWSHATKTQGGPLTQTFLKPRYISWIITSFSSLHPTAFKFRLYHWYNL